MKDQEPTQPLAGSAGPELGVGETLPYDGIVDPPRAQLPFGGSIGRYLVIEVLGRGGMGVVYAAFDPVLDRRIAVKLLRHGFDADATEGRARMQREAQALARLSHPNVITVHDVSQHDGVMYIAMELVAGGTLRDWQHGKPWRAIVDAYTDAARGLAAAHATGLVHRDFKPENVLVGDDGRVRVTDFGLARLAIDPAAEIAAPSHASPTSLSSSITEAGAVMGTPSYMSPEQIEGDVVDARTDQFAWCIALWEALYGAPPFGGTTLAERCKLVKAGPPKVPEVAGIPRALGKILARGVAADPAARWPSLDDLLAAIATATSMRKKALVAAGVAATMVLVGVFAIGRHAGRTDAPVAAPRCDAAGAPVDAVWTPAARAAIAKSFAATDVAYARDTAAAVTGAIDTWRGRFVAIAQDSCRATRVAGTQSEAMLDLRTACLAQRRDQLAAIVETLGRADRALVDHAAELTTHLPELEPCNDVAQLSGVAPRPREPAALAAVVAVEAALAPIEAELVRGVALERAKALEPAATAAVTAAIATAWMPLVARARETLAGVQRELGRGKAARATLIDAASAATAAGDGDRLVDLYIELVDVEARLTSDYALGDGWASLADGTLARLGPRTDKRLRLARVRGLDARRAGRLDDARAAYRAALAIATNTSSEAIVLDELGIVDTELGELAPAVDELGRARTLALRDLGEHHPRVAAIEHDLGTVAYRQGKYAEAEARFAASLAIRARSTQTDDLAMANTVEALGVAELADSKLALANEHLARALHSFEAQLGPDHPDVANALNDIGGAYHRVGDYAQAFAIGQRALAIREKALGPDHPDVGQSLVNTAIEAKALGKWDVVEPHYVRAIAIFEKSYGAKAVETAITRLNYAEALRARGKLDLAAAEYARAKDILVADLGEEHPILSNIWNGVGQLELARGHRALAVPLLERAVAMREKDPGDQPALAESRFALARAITDPARATQLATQARDGFRGAGPGHAKEAAAIDAWLRR